MNDKQTHPKIKAWAMMGKGWSRDSKWEIAKFLMDGDGCQEYVLLESRSMARKFKRCSNYKVTRVVSVTIILPKSARKKSNKNHSALSKE